MAMTYFNNKVFSIVLENTNKAQLFKKGVFLTEVNPYEYLDNPDKYKKRFSILGLPKYIGKEFDSLVNPRNKKSANIWDYQRIFCC